MIYLGGMWPDMKDDRKACGLIVRMANAHYPVAYQLEANAPWNPNRHTPVENYAWQAVGMAAINPSKPLPVVGATIPDGDASEAQQRAHRYIEAYLKQSTPICVPANLKGVP